MEPAVRNVPLLMAGIFRFLFYPVGMPTLSVTTCGVDGVGGELASAGHLLD
ncbi:MAG: hypothetical protein ACP5P1_09285 [Acidimicrobiales bacterium]